MYVCVCVLCCCRGSYERRLLAYLFSAFITCLCLLVALVSCMTLLAPTCAIHHASTRDAALSPPYPSAIYCLLLSSAGCCHLATRYCRYIVTTRAAALPDTLRANASRCPAAAAAAAAAGGASAMAKLRVSSARSKEGAWSGAREGCTGCAMLR